MMTLVFWLLALVLFALATRAGRHFGVIPIVSQLLLASLGLPLLMLLWIEPHWQLTGAQLVTPTWLKSLYSLSFALLLGHILSDVIDLRLDRQSLKIALPSFAVPFTCGLACAVWLLPEQPWLSSLAVGLVFAITAIPVLYLYLRHIDYPPAATRRLVQSAIVIDLTCWSLFGLAQGTLDLNSLLRVQAQDLPGVTLVDRLGDLNKVFAATQISAAELKLLSCVLIVLLLIAPFGFGGALRIVALPLLAALCSLASLGWLGQPLTLFSLFGLLLVTAISVDYAILMREQIGGAAVSLLGTLLAALTTWLSFGLLAVSSTPAVSNFGLSVSLGLAFSFILAPWAGKQVHRS